MLCRLTAHIIQIFGRRQLSPKATPTIGMLLTRMSANLALEQQILGLRSIWNLREIIYKDHEIYSLYMLAILLFVVHAIEC